jgi:hypothetical protein
MDPRFEQFIQERKYILNVSPATLDWCKHSLKWLPMLRDVKLLCKRPGIVPPACTIHAFRHYAESETMPN